MNIPRPLVQLITFGLLAAAIFGGCSKKMTILQVPEFYDPSLRTIAVVPFRSPMDNGAAGRLIADQLAAELQANGTYQVINRNDLKALMDERDLAIALSADPSSAASKFKQLGNVQAILTGSVGTYAAKSVKQFRQEPIYAYDSRGNQYIQGYRSYEHLFNSGAVSATAALIRVSDQTVIHATPVPASWKQSCQGRYPKYNEMECLAIARNNVVRQLLAEFAIVRKEIKVNPRKALRTATELYDDKWSYSDKFGVDSTRMIVVVSLPPECGRNKFRLAIVRAGKRDVLAHREFTWSRSSPARGIGFEFSPVDIASKGGGTGRYLVKFYNGPTAVMEHGFRIVDEK